MHRSKMSDKDQNSSDSWENLDYETEKPGNGALKVQSAVATSTGGKATVPKDYEKHLMTESKTSYILILQIDSFCLIF